MTTNYSIQDIRNRAKAAFIGLAIGDALGATVEFMKPGEIAYQYGIHRDIIGGGWLRLKPGQITDDTEMSLCIARAIISAKKFSLKGIADNFTAWLRSKPADIGDTCRRGIRSYALEGTLEVAHHEWHAGNGACMRMLPVALYTLGDDSSLTELAIQQAHLTHNHPLSDAACIYLGRLLHFALLGFSKSRLRQELEGLFSRHPNFRFEPYPGLATAYVPDTLQTVFHYFFRTRGFESCLVETVNQGDDADTTGAIAGMLAGAYYGMEDIPKRWLKKMNGNMLDELSTLAEQLVEMSFLAASIKMSRGSSSP
jgi:ADP-ribosyl-[dinitrogen reductase] hydrolase